MNETIRRAAALALASVLVAQVNAQTNEAQEGSQTETQEGSKDDEKKKKL